MPITIPEDIRYNRRDYTIGNVIELDDSMLGDDPRNNPIFVPVSYTHLTLPTSDLV